MKKLWKTIRWVVILPILIVAYSLFEPFWIQVKRVEIDHADIHGAFSGFTIVFLTDIHHGPYFSQNRLNRLVSKTNHLNADMILLGGDYFHRYDTKYVYSFFESISELNAEYGVFAVMGNHDYWMGEELVIEQMKQSGINLLRNNGVWIVKEEGRFFLGGVDDKMAGKPDLQKAIEGTQKEAFTLVVSHHPDVVEEHSLKNVDWILAGHTHGGQVSLFGLWSPIVPSAHGQQYRSGIVQKGETTILVSNGIGTITPPLRFFARPQLIHITLR